MRVLWSLIILAPHLVSAQSDSSVASGRSSQEIYNGIQHLDYPTFTTGIAYYKANDWQPGSIIYRAVYYPSVFLKYDLIENQVVIRHFNGSTGITLFTPRIKQFTIAGRSFLLFDKNEHSSLPDGLYEEIEKGRISFYIHRSKYIKEIVTGLTIEKRVVDNDAYYVLKDGRWYPVKKEKNLLELVKDKRNEIRNDLKKKDLKYRIDPEATLAEIVSYYNKATS